MKTLEVHVTADDILKGKARDNCSCAIALAVHRARPDAGYVSVVPDHISLAPELYAPDGEYEYYALPEEAQRFIPAFDRGEKVEPITFTATDLSAEA